MGIVRDGSSFATYPVGPQGVQGDGVHGAWLVCCYVVVVSPQTPARDLWRQLMSHDDAPVAQSNAAAAADAL